MNFHRSNRSPLLFITSMILALGAWSKGSNADDTSASEVHSFEAQVRPFLEQYCFDCHSGDEIRGEVNFDGIESEKDVEESFELWESVIGHLRSQTMPPEDATQPRRDESEKVEAWILGFIKGIEPRPAVFRPRRLSVSEYRNTLRSVLGFDLSVDVIKAEQTVSESSMVVKLLPEDPPGKSGFKNDTHSNPLSSVAWDQYSCLIDAAVEELFSLARREQLERLAGDLDGEFVSEQQAQVLLRKIVPRALRRDIREERLAPMFDRLSGKRGRDLTAALKLEIETVLMSSSFLYRGLLIERQTDGRQPVDSFELAERLSYFLWSDMPDETLLAAASNRSLLDPEIYRIQVERMIDSTKSRRLADGFFAEWLSLNEIIHVSNNPPVSSALFSQPIDFVNYLVRENRPLTELINSQTAFANSFTAKMYGSDSKQLVKQRKETGIEQKAYPNQVIQIRSAKERGGILTMPGILAMNRGPILRGTWVLERILGETLPDPPANVGQVPPNKRGQTLSFRKRFEQHRQQASCALCHDKIDPIGFALEAFDQNGEYRMAAGYRPRRSRKSDGDSRPTLESIDTSGRLPTGETFDGIHDLKQILVTTQRESVIRNIVERMMAYALCRQLTAHDYGVVTSITQKMLRDEGTWRNLIHEIVNSILFKETILSEAESR